MFVWSTFHSTLTHSITMSYNIHSMFSLDFNNSYCMALHRRWLLTDWITFSMENCIESSVEIIIEIKKKNFQIKMLCCVMCDVWWWCYDGGWFFFYFINYIIYVIYSFHFFKTSNITKFTVHSPFHYILFLWQWTHTS